MFDLIYPLISVVIPCYNSSKTIRETLLSVCLQSYRNLEIIIVNDGSTDNFLEKIEDILISDSRIRVIDQHNIGLAGARNTGIRSSKGQFVSLIDADDTWKSEKLELQIQHLQSNPSLGISFCRSQFMDEDSNLINYFQMPDLNNIDFIKCLVRNPVSNGSTPLIRIETLEDIMYWNGQKDCFFDENFRQAEDVELWCRILLTTNWKIEGLPHVLTYYRISNSGLSADTSKQEAALNQLLDKMSLYKPKEEYESVAKAYQYRYLSRRAVRSLQGKIAVHYINKSFSTSITPILQEPLRSFLTFAAAYMLFLLPSFLYSTIESFSIKLTGNKQKKIINSQILN